MHIMGIVLAGGQGKRMKSKLYKVLHPVCGKPMVGHVIEVLEKIQTSRTVVIVGHGAEAVQEYLGNRVEYAIQEQQLGTGHAAMQAEAMLGAEEGISIVICGDSPLVSEQSLRKLIEWHNEKSAAATILTAYMEQPEGYGRVIRGERGTVIRIVENKDCTSAELEVKEINAGTYCFDNRVLFEALRKVTNDNAQNEYYLTDVIGILVREEQTVEGYRTSDAEEAIGINDRLALSQAEQLMRQRINRDHMLNGVTIVDPASTYIDKDVRIGTDTTIFPGTQLSGATQIGSGCVIGPQTEIAHSRIDDGALVKQSVVHQTVIGAGTTVGPFAYLRPGTHLGKSVKIGDFVEVKNATIEDGSKVSHLSYIGDAKVGKNVNIGCGAITVNYDGYNKHTTEIGDDAFVGSNVNIIAPVKIGKGAYVVAGSTITNDVQENDLAIARERQTNKPGYAEKLRGRIRPSKKDQE